MAPTDRTIVLAGEDGEVQRFTVLGETGVRGKRGREKGLSKAYVYVFQDALERIAADRGMKQTHFRVLMAHLSRATLETPHWLAEPAVVGELLGMRADEVSRITSQIVARGYLVRPRPGLLALPPDVAWRGSAASRKIAQGEGSEP